MAQDLTVRSIQGATLDAREDRLAQEWMTEGLLAYGDEFKVQEQASPGMSVRVGSGSAGDRYVVPGLHGQGVFIVLNQNDSYVGSGNTDVPIANGDGSNPRIDGIDLQIFDDEADSSGETKAEIVVTEGTPAGSPSAPAVPDGAVRLATVLVPTGESTSIEDGDITDMREVSNAWSRPRGEVGYSAATSGQSSITTEADITSCSVTVATEAGRIYRVVGDGQTNATASGAVLIGGIYEGSSEIGRWAQRAQHSANAAQKESGSARSRPGAGPTTYKLTLRMSSGSGSVSTSGSSSAPVSITVEDVGGFAPKDA